MRTATRFSIAVHILSLIGMEYVPDPTSEYIAGSVGVNPVVIRNITGMLKKAGFVTSSQGRAGTHLARALDQITLLDVFQAVEAGDEIFGMHQHPHPNCPVGCRIQGALESVFLDAQRAMEKQLASTTVESVIGRIRSEA